MKNRIREIIVQLDEGKIDHNKAIKLINNIDTSYERINKTAYRLKIIVIDDKQSIKIPGIPFWLINLFIDMGLGLGSIALKFVKDLDEDVKQVLGSVNPKDIKELFKELRNYGPFELVNVQSGYGTQVKISLL